MLQTVAVMIVLGEPELRYRLLLRAEIGDIRSSGVTRSYPLAMAKSAKSPFYAVFVDAGAPL